MPPSLAFKTAKNSGFDPGTGGLHFGESLQRGEGLFAGRQVEFPGGADFLAATGDRRHGRDLEALGERKALVHVQKPLRAQILKESLKNFLGHGIEPLDLARTPQGAVLVVHLAYKDLEDVI